MNEGSRKTALVIGAVAAAGVAIASYLMLWRRRTARREEPTPLRSVTEMLSDLQAKMRELQNHLAELTPPTASPATPN